MSRLPSSAGVERPLCAKWIESAFKKFSCRVRMLLRLKGRFVAVTGLADIGDALAPAMACEDVPEGRDWILG